MFINVKNEINVRLFLTVLYHIILITTVLYHIFVHEVQVYIYALRRKRRIFKCYKFDRLIKLLRAMNLVK